MAVTAAPKVIAAQLSKQSKAKKSKDSGNEKETHNEREDKKIVSILSIKSI